MDYGDSWLPYLTVQVLHRCTSDGITMWGIRRAFSCWVDKRARIDKFFHYHNLLPLGCDCQWLVLPAAQSWTFFVFCQFNSSPTDVAYVAMVSSTDTRSSSSSAKRATKVQVRKRVPTKWHSIHGWTNSFFLLSSSQSTPMVKESGASTHPWRTVFNCEPGTLRLGCTNTANRVAVQGLD